MDDGVKSKEQLVEELRQLRQRITETEELLKLSGAPCAAKHQDLEEAVEPLPGEETATQTAVPRVTEPGNAFLAGLTTAGIPADDFAFSMADWSWEIDRSGFITSCSEAVCHTIGYTSEEMIGRNPFDTVAPDQKASIEELFSQAVYKQELIKDVESRHVTKSGKVRWLLTTASPILDDQGRPTGYRGVTKDITNLKRAEEELEKTQALLLAAIEQSPAGILIADAPGAQVRLANSAALGIEGETSGPLTEIPADQHPAYWHVWHPDGTPFQSKDFPLARAIRTGEISKNVEAVIRRPSGEDRWVLANAAPVRNAAGDVIAGVVVFPDITEFKRAENALRESEERYRLLAQNSLTGIYIHQDGDFVYVNERLTSLLGYEPEQILGKKYWEFIHPDDVERVRQIGATGPMAAAAPDCYEFRVLCKGGKTTWVEAFITTIQYRGRVATMGNVADVTERRQAEDRLRESEERFRMLSEAAEEGIVIHDKGIIVDSNQSAARMLGYELNELLGMNSERLATRESWQIMAGHIASGYDKPYEAVGLRKDGSTFPALLVGKPFQYKGKNLRISCIRDLTELKRAEMELRASEEKYRKILETIADGYHEVDLYGNLTLVNDSLCEIIGYSRDELIGLSYREVVSRHHLERVFQSYNTVYKTSRANRGFYYQAVRKDGTRRDVSASVALTKDEDGKPIGFRGILRDVTEQRQLEEQLRQASKMEAIGRLAGGIAHDFNNLLTAMIGYANMLKMSLPKEDPNQDKLRQIGRAADRAASLTQQLLAFSRKQVLEMQILDLNEVVEGLKEMLRRLIGENIHLVTVLDPSVEKINADPGQIEQILMNLAVNSRDAMPAGGKVIIETGCVTLDEGYVSTRPQMTAGNYVRLSVSDTGKGMDEDTLSRIFDPFFTTKEKGVGTGLGLSTVYGIVKQHRGHVAAYSSPGQGSMFEVLFPCAEKVVETSDSSSHTASHPRGVETILVVEDEEIVRQLSCEMLQMLGYSVLGACDAEEAVAVSKAYPRPIDLLFTDVVLPKMDGRSLFNSLNAERQDLKVIYSSGYTDDAIVHHGVLEPGVHFLHKPFTFDRLARKVREVLDEKDSR